ncbi:MAG: helix-turn-helix transcriptional regulator [Planctomycetes bacterium]|nr:helix-turn-helix transcriptional regulator [Planctomycetota bacterium]MCB9871753.1 helix-turn-helix transcriptional regulator [Planctomycetota bacterium]
MTAATTQQVFRAIADPARRSILDRLAREGATAALELGAGFHGSQPALSKHLRVLREAGLVRTRRDGRRVLYTLRPGPLADVERWISLYRQFWEGRLDALARHLDETP